jgi:hypothetical protein
LLTPGLGKRAAVYRIEAERVDQLEGDALVLGVVAGDRQRDPAALAGRLPVLQQVLPEDAVEDLEDRRSQETRDPDALGVPASIASIRPSRSRG